MATISTVYTFGYSGFNYNASNLTIEELDSLIMVWAYSGQNASPIGILDIPLPSFQRYVFSFGSQTTNSAPTPDVHLAFCYWLNSSVVTNSASLNWNIQGFQAYRQAGVLYRIKPSKGKRLSLKSAPVGTTGTATSASFAGFGSLKETDIVIGATATASSNYFTDSDTTDGSWASVERNAYTASQPIGISSQTKIVTGSSSQTYGGTFVNGSATYVIGGIVLEEINAPHWGTWTA